MAVACVDVVDVRVVRADESCGPVATCLDAGHVHLSAILLVPFMDLGWQRADSQRQAAHSPDATTHVFMRTYSCAR